MIQLRLACSLFVCFSILCPCLLDAQQNRMTPELLWKLGRLGETAVADDQSSVVYTVRHYDLAENSGSSTLRQINFASHTDQVLLEGWSSLNSIQWSTHGGQPVLYFLGVPPKPEEDDEDESDDEDEDEDEDENEDEADDDEDEHEDQGEQADPSQSPQVYRLNITDGGEPIMVTQIDDGVANLNVSPEGKLLAFTLDIKLDEAVTERHPDLPQADARIIDQLMFRHWNAWHDYKYSHLHVAKIGDDGLAGTANDLMADMRVDCPVPPFGGSEQFAWSPAGDEICYTAKIVDRWAESTDSDLYLVRINSDGKAFGKAKNITDGMDGYDNDPFYSPDGQFLAFHSMERPSFESDRNRIMLYDRDSGGITELTVGLDQNAGHAQWTPDSSGVLFVSETRGTNQIFRMDRGDQQATQLTEGPYNWDLVQPMTDVDSDDFHALLVTKTSMIRPAELHAWSLDVDTNERDMKLTSINDEIYAELQLPTVQERWVEATDGKRIHCWVIYPPGFDQSKKYPMLTYCQGGPQGQIGQWFSYRWNFHLMAAHDYVIVAPNRRGLPGFGRAWNDQISGDWGGQAMQDILSATDDMLSEPYIDREKAAAIGASFGGYTVYWLMGHHEDRFAAMIAHCGVFNLESMYGSTEELFFVNWDLGGPYWKSRDIQEAYDRFSPHRFVRNWQTPLMVIHGERDFRVPVTQGIEAFTAAQVQGVKSRFLYFPGEGHWVLQPQNGVLWHREFFAWLDQFCKE